MDERTYCLTPEQWRHAKACLTLAKRWGLIGDDAWYDANPDLFTRYAGDSFPYEEVKQIIEKRMREEVYDSLVQDLLRGPADRP